MPSCVMESVSWKVMLTYVPSFDGNVNSRLASRTMKVDQIESPSMAYLAV
jgi:hypothetical protein